MRSIREAFTLATRRRTGDESDSNGDRMEFATAHGNISALLLKRCKNQVHLLTYFVWTLPSAGKALKPTTRIGSCPLLHASDFTAY